MAYFDLEIHQIQGMSNVFVFGVQEVNSRKYYHLRYHVPNLSFYNFFNKLLIELLHYKRNGFCIPVLDTNKFLGVCKRAEG